MAAQLHASPGVLYGGSGAPREGRGSGGGQPQFPGSEARYGPSARMTAPHNSTHLTVTPTSVYPRVEEGQPFQAAIGNGGLSVPAPDFQLGSRLRATPTRTTGEPHPNVYNNIPRFGNRHPPNANMDWQKATVGPAATHGVYEAPQAAAEGSQWVAGGPANTSGRVPGSSGQFFRRRQQPPGPPPPHASGPVSQGFETPGGLPGPEGSQGGEAVLQACAAASGAVAQVLFTVIRGVYQSTADVINSWARPAWERKLNYHPYSAQSYQIGDYEYEVMVYRKPRSYCAKMMRPS